MNIVLILESVPLPYGNNILTLRYSLKIINLAIIGLNEAVEMTIPESADSDCKQ